MRQQITKENGIDYFVLKPFVEAIELGWKNQRELIERDALLNSTTLNLGVVAKDKKQREMEGSSQ
jgi:hypothetical protein